MEKSLKKIRVFVAGKINLSLNILGLKQNMHLIDSVMVSVSLGDFVSVAMRSDSRININFTGAFSSALDCKNNSVKKTVDYLLGRIGDFGADITVEKNIPLAAGLGGSSADIAGTLAALDCLLGLQMRGLDLSAAAADLGSDVPFMLRGGCARVAGTGEIITPAQNNLDLYMVVATGGTGVGSGDAYRRFDALNPSFADIKSDNDKLAGLLRAGDNAAIGLFDNALTDASDSLCSGGIYLLKKLLLDAGAVNAVMTGSGSAVVGFYPDFAAAQSAAQAVGRQGFFAQACCLAKKGVTVSD